MAAFGEYRLALSEVSTAALTSAKAMQALAAQADQMARLVRSLRAIARQPRIVVCSRDWTGTDGRSPLDIWKDWLKREPWGK